MGDKILILRQKSGILSDSQLELVLTLAMEHHGALVRTPRLLATTTEAFYPLEPPSLLLPSSANSSPLFVWFKLVLEI